MPINYLSTLTAKPRTLQANLHMGVLLTLVAGALNAGGFLAVGQYTSHMTGMVSTFAAQLVLLNFELATVALASWIAFVLGAASTAVLVNHSERQGIQNRDALPLHDVEHGIGVEPLLKHQGGAGGEPGIHIHRLGE